MDGWDRPFVAIKVESRDSREIETTATMVELIFRKSNGHYETARYNSMDDGTRYLSGIPRVGMTEDIFQRVRDLLDGKEIGHACSPENQFIKMV